MVFLVLPKEGGLAKTAELPTTHPAPHHTTSRESLLYTGNGAKRVVST